MAIGINQLLNWLLSWVPSGLVGRADSVIGYVAASLVHIGLLINVVAVGALIFIWLERKVSGRIQDRLGPTRVGGKFGWLQTLADGIKLITKEDLMPGGADGMLFRIAPYISFCASFCGVHGAAVRRRLGRRCRLNVGRVLHPRRAGPGSVRRDPGRLRLGLEVVAVRRHARSGPGGELRSAAGHVRRRAGADRRHDEPGHDRPACKQGWFTNWFIFHDPFTFVAFWVYFTCATASVNRAPFDLAEAESELVAGFHTEYSGLRWCFFFMAEYGSMFAVSGLAAILFFGGWNGPIPITRLARADVRALGTGCWHTSATCWACSTSSASASFGVTVMMWVRWTLPRLRIDQVMTTCLKYCTPIAAVMFLGATLWPYYLPGGRSSAAADRRRRRIRCAKTGRQLGSKTAAQQRRRPPTASKSRRQCAIARTRRCLSARSIERGQPINWHFVLLPALRAARLRLCAWPWWSRSNIVRMAFYLVLSLGATAGLFFLAGADFVGAMQLLIYVGGTLVLLVFGVMLTAQGPFHLDENRPRRMDRRGARRRRACWPCWSGPRSACRRGQRPRPSHGRRRSDSQPTASRRSAWGCLGDRASTDPIALAATCCRSKLSRCICWSC